jgi:hypothetical protein
MKFICAFFLFFILFSSYGQTMISSGLNFSTFKTPRSKKITTELSEITPAPFKLNPDYGLLPYDASCVDCIELIHLRTDSTRQYQKETTVYSQKGNCSINYVDDNGFYRDIVTAINTTSIVGEYSAINQPYPTFININNKNVSIKSGTEKFDFCRNLKLYFQDSLGVKTLLNSANWTGASIGDDGLYVSNIFPNIDLQAHALQGAFKTSFIVNSNLGLSKKGWLIISDEILIPSATTISYSSGLDLDNKLDGNIYFNNPTGHNFTILQGIVTSPIRTSFSQLFFRMAGGNFEMLTSTNWLNDTSTHYPIIIDPVVTNSNSLPQISITGSGLNNSGSFVGYCNYNLTVARPPNCTLNGITFSFGYIAQNGAWLSEGAMKFTLVGCISPTAAMSFWFCNTPGGGTCTGSGISLWSDFSSCVSPLAACSGNLTFGMRFFDAYAGSSCSNTFIGANTAWTMTLIGNNLQTLGNTTTGNGVINLTPACNSTQLLNPNPTSGVGPFTYLWSPGGQITSTKTISTFFLGTQSHSCTVTDACGVSRVAVFNVTPNCFLPVELLSFNAIDNQSFVNIEWVTASENNSDYFTIEKSYDALSFSFLEKVKAAGQSSATKKYNVQDSHPNKNGFTYYRLKQMDFGGVEKFSKVCSVEITEESNELSIVPNPTEGTFNVNLSHNLSGKIIDVELYDVAGKKSILKQNIEINSSNKTLNFNISEFPNGIYFIKVVATDGTLFKNKIIKY